MAFPAPHYTISLAVLKVASDFFSLQGRRSARELSSEQSYSGVPGSPGAAKADKLLAVGSGEHLHTPSHVSATLHGWSEEGKDFLHH